MRAVRVLSPLGIALFGACAGAADLPGSQTVWFTIQQTDGQAIGQVSQETVPTADGRQIIEDQQLDLVEGKGVPSRVIDHQVIREDAAGKVVSISEASSAEGSSSRTETRIVGTVATITRDTAADHHVVTLALEPSVSVEGEGALLSAWNPQVHPRLEFDSLNPSAMAIEHVVIEPVAGQAPGPDGAMTVVRRAYDGDQVIGLSRLVLDAERRVIATTQPMFGATITIRPADRATALDHHAAYQVLTSAMTKSPYRIPDEAFQGHIRYRFAFKDGLNFDLPQTGEQRIAAGPDGVTVDICQDCGPGLASDRKSLADDLKATAWMQSDDPRLKALAGPVAKQTISDTEKMQALARITRRHMTQVDYVGHYSALETLSRQSGDCTESAVLLAALGRSAGIPTKVVSGLVYSRPFYHGVSNVFLPHSWVLAYADGKWRSFDAALETFDVTHIALSVGDGDDRSIGAAGELGSLLRLDAMNEVRARPVG